MKLWHKAIRWRRRGSKCSEMESPLPRTPVQPVGNHTNSSIVWLVSELDGNTSRIGENQPDVNQEEEEEEEEEEETKVDPSRHSYGAKGFVAEEQRRGGDNADERLLRKQELVRAGDKEEIQELRASLLQLRDDLRRNEEMAAARLKAVEDEKAKLEVALLAERAKAARQQKTMQFLRETNIEAQSLETELRDQVETLKMARRQHDEGQFQSKEEKVRSGLARLVEKDLRKQVAMLEQSTGQQANEIRVLLAQLQVLQRNGEPHIDSVLMVGNTQGANATLSALGDSHPDRPRLRADFLSGWRTLTGLAIERIFRIKVPADVGDTHASYVRSHGNVVQRFHGTSCRSRCNFIIDPKKASPCGLQACKLCNICLRGFKLGKASRRFGQGVYFSTKSAKANGYAQGTEKKTEGSGKKLRCIIVADVAKGRSFITKETGFDHGTYPPVGHDSVQAEVGKGLAFEELVVYKEEAALPTHLIVYTLP
ncbi:unnamed protein product [Ectocarpus sp. 12 AP-2014]